MVKKNNDVMDEYNKVYLYINEVKTYLYEGNRYGGILIDFNKKLENVLAATKTTIKKGTILFRARIYNEDDKYSKILIKDKDADFIGYGKKESDINLNAPEERMNPKGIKTLYASRDLETTLLEVNASNNDFVSVAKIKCKEDLLIADLSKLFGFGDNRFEALFSLQIQNAMNNDDIKIGYLFSQYISMQCKLLGYDGIGYASKYASIKSISENKKGINYAIYSYNKCEPISSDFYEIGERSLKIYNRKTDSIKVTKI